VDYRRDIKESKMYKMIKKKKTKKKVVKKKATKKKSKPKVLAAVSHDENWIYCDTCNEPTSFKYASRGLEQHNVATCADCLIKLDKAEVKKKEDTYMLSRSKQRRARVMGNARASLNTCRGL
jgi:hypothetical protein